MTVERSKKRFVAVAAAAVLTLFSATTTEGAENRPDDTHQRYRVSIRMSDEFGRSFTYRRAIDQRQYDALVYRGLRTATDLMRQAQIERAERTSLPSHVYGEDGFKLMQVIIEWVGVFDDVRGRSQTVYSRFGATKTSS